METKKMEPWKIPLCALAGTASAPHCFADGRSWAIGRTSRTILELFFGPGTAGWSCARFNGSLDRHCSDGGALVPGAGKSGRLPLQVENLQIPLIVLLFRFLVAFAHSSFSRLCCLCTPFPNLPIPKPPSHLMIIGDSSIHYIGDSRQSLDPLEQAMGILLVDIIKYFSNQRLIMLITIRIMKKDPIS